MPGISPEEMAQMQAEAGGEQDGPGDITKLAQQVGDGLNKLAETLNNSPAATDQDREKMAMVMNGFIELVEKNLGGAAPGEDPEAEPQPEQDVVPADAGRGGVPMGPQARR